MKRSSALAAATLGLVFSTSALAATTMTVEPSGRLLKDGVPWFPLGIYHVSWIGDRQGAEAVPDLIEAADSGFDTFNATIDARPNTIELLDTAASRGVEIFAEIPWPEHGPAGFVNLWKSHPAIAGWYIQDDFNSPTFGPSNHPPAEVAARKDVIDMLDPGRLTYASGTPFPGANVAPYAGTMELMGFQSYVIAEQSYPFEYELEESMDEYDYVRAQLAGTGQSWVANAQAYRWKSSVGRYPTLRESRNLLYSPVIRGANGVIWYAMWEGNGTLLPSVVPELWADLAKQVAEMKSMRPFLLEGTLTIPLTGLERVHAGLWEHEGQVVVVVLSTHRTDSYPVSIPLPVAAYESLQPMFPGRTESGMTLDSGNLVGTIGPEETHVYLLDAAVPGNDSPVADIAATPDDVAYGEERSFDASGSTDDTGIVSYEWDFGDGGVATGASAMHAYTRPGTYWTRLTVRDDDGATATAYEETTVSLTSLCAAAPRLDCTAGTGSIRASMPASASRRSLKWNWRDAPVASFGTPTTTTEIALCMYDGTGRVLATGAQPDPALWQDRGDGGLRFKDKDARPGGLSLMKLVADASDARAQLKAKGSALPSLTFPLVPPVVVQLVGSDTTECEEARFESADISGNAGTKFSAKN
jgi:PKD repeat protein